MLTHKFDIISSTVEKYICELGHIYTPFEVSPGGRMKWLRPPPNTNSYNRTQKNGKKYNHSEQTHLKSIIYQVTRNYLALKDITSTYMIYYKMKTAHNKIKNKHLNRYEN